MATVGQLEGHSISGHSLRGRGGGEGRERAKGEGDSARERVSERACERG